MTENELYHYGVKGMRWGHRKSVHKAEKKLNKLAKKSTKAKTITNHMKTPTNLLTLELENLYPQHNTVGGMHLMLERSKEHALSTLKKFLKKQKEKLKSIWIHLVRIMS